MNDLKEEFRRVFSKPNNSHIQLIVINIAVFVMLGIVYVVSQWFGDGEVFSAIYKQFTIPPHLSEFVTRPWTIITYAFAHSMPSLFHILINMLVLYWFSRIIVEYLGSDKVISLYVMGALGGAVAYLLIYNFIPYYTERSAFPGMVGASASVYAIMVAAAVYMPNYTFFMLFLGPVRIKYIALVLILLSFLGTVDNNAGGNIAHLGGAAMGYLFAVQFRKGNDIGAWVIGTLSVIRGWFTNKPKMKVNYRKKEPTYTRAGGQTSKSTLSQPDQAEIDAILDKISESGYDSLTKEEKEKLFNASKK